MKKSDFAKIVGCSQGHLSGILAGKKQCSPQLARKIEEATQGVVSAEEMVFLQDILKEEEPLLTPKSKYKNNVEKTVIGTTVEK